MENKKGNEQSKENLVEVKIEDFKKVGDFWAKHNVGTRMMMIVFAVSFLAVVIAAFFGTVVATPIVNMVWYSALIGFGVVTLGVNGLEKLLDGIAKIKLGEKQGE